MLIKTNNTDVKGQLVITVFSPFDINSEEEGITKVWHSTMSRICTQRNKKEKLKENQ